MSASTTATDLENCDVIFRGGITSGVVYPGAVETLAEKYRFRRIGGASAGAIAAGLTAAAEYGRQQRQDFQPFRDLGATAKDISGAPDSVTSLGKLFQPTPRTRSLHRVLILALRWKKLIPPAAILALLMPLLLSLFNATLGVLAYLLLLLPIIWLTRQLVWVMPRSGFGLCGGANPELDGKDIETQRREGALSDWLHAEIQRAAGRKTGFTPRQPDENRPLTMGDLWGEGPTREIDLVLTTTNLSQQLPHSFPYLEKTENRLFFSPEHLKTVLPSDVIAWLVFKAQPNGQRMPQPAEGFLHLPKPEDLPVVFGVRLSLSFPGLVAAVPLFARNHDTYPNINPTFKPEVCWFSDGGITSNFPIHLFDSPLPRYPTFCVTLRGATEVELQRQPPASPEPGMSPDALVTMACDNIADIRPRFAPPIGHSLLSFVNAILDTARNGQENELMLMPGQRDRIVHILTRPDEGGLNLNMTAEVIQRMSARGKVAADLLITRFHPDEAAARAGFTLDWRNQRWVRFRASLAAVERLLADIHRGWHAEQPPGAGYQALMATPPSYCWPPGDASAAAASRNMERLLKFAEELRAEAESLGKGATIYDGLPDNNGNAPRPKPGLKMRPLGSDPRDLETYLINAAPKPPAAPPPPSARQRP